MRGESQSKSRRMTSSHLIDAPDDLGRRDFLRNVGGGLLVAVRLAAEFASGMQEGDGEPGIPGPETRRAAG